MFAVSCMSYCMVWVVVLVRLAVPLQSVVLLPPWVPFVLRQSFSARGVAVPCGLKDAAADDDVADVGDQQRADATVFHATSEPARSCVIVRFFVREGQSPSKRCATHARKQGGQQSLDFVECRG